ncbi:hypothetical protein [Brachybacterium tyrofermentans]|uniref:hypothetical protein n=1 Tax=Brachybacterium tyrofermentans TaxID=47848 RepID=UPI003FD17556
MRSTSIGTILTTAPAFTSSSTSGPSDGRAATTVLPASRRPMTLSRNMRSEPNISAPGWTASTVRP